MRHDRQVLSIRKELITNRFQVFIVKVNKHVFNSSSQPGLGAWTKSCNLWPGPIGVCLGLLLPWIIQGEIIFTCKVWETFLLLKNFQLKIPRHWSLNLFSCPLLSQPTYLLVQCLLTLRAQTEANRLHVSL